MPLQAFHEVQFPPSISYGAVGGPSFKTTVIELSSGAERRNQEWQLARGQWDVAHGLKTQAELNVLLKFFFARRGMLYGFRYKDWTDFRLPLFSKAPGDLDAVPVQFATDGRTSSFQLSKIYGDGANTYIRPLYKPVAGTVQLSANGNAITDWSIDPTTGMVTLGATTTATIGWVIQVSCEFDTPVRFNTDSMKVSLDDYNSLSWGQIPLVELKF